jgi:hypothetical protein
MGILRKRFRDSGFSVSRRQVSLWRRRRAPRARRAALEPLEERTMLSVDLSLVETGLQGSFFTELQAKLETDVFAAPAPLIGDQLASEAPGQFVGKVGDAMKAFSLASAQSDGVTIPEVKEALEQALASEPSIQVESIGDSSSPDGTEVRFLVTLSADETGLVDLDLAL